MNLAPKLYTCDLEVRGYELDSFGHVNHAEYVRYFEHARWKFLESEGITLKTFKDWNAYPVIGEIKVRYLKPTFLGDSLRVESRIVEAAGTRFRVEHTLLRNTERVAEGEVWIVMVNEKGRPTALPEQVQSLSKISTGASP